MSGTGFSIGFSGFSLGFGTGLVIMIGFLAGAGAGVVVVVGGGLVVNLFMLIVCRSPVGP